VLGDDVDTTECAVGCIEDAHIVRFGDDKGVSHVKGSYVKENQHLWVFVDYACRRRLVDNSAEHAVFVKCQSVHR
jgi:hypothetical protein